MKMMALVEKPQPAPIVPAQRRPSWERHTVRHSARFRGGRYLSAEASARGEWQPGGATHAGYDAYATTKQCELAAALELARETPRVHINAVEPGFSPGTGLGRDANAVVRFVTRYLLQPLAQRMK